MSSDYFIEVNSVNKCYPVLTQPLSPLKQAIIPRIKRLWKSFPSVSKSPVFKFDHEFHGLEHMSLEVNRGKTIGIVGRNAPVKSTLLPIVCGMLTATSGGAKVEGRYGVVDLGGFCEQISGSHSNEYNL
ncbi:MAG: ATP-binding cassette domain-containing protein [Mariprofundaceae bacterium]